MLLHVVFLKNYNSTFHFHPKSVFGLRPVTTAGMYDTNSEFCFASNPIVDIINNWKIPLFFVFFFSFFSLM